MDNDKIIFDDKSMTDLYREMYNRSENKKTQINTILSDIQKHITDKNDAILMLPRINDFMIVGVKNDDNFLKMIAVIQKMETLKDGAVNGELLSEEEKEQLRNSIESSVTDLRSSINVPVENFKV
jgi:uncharacterized protein YeeX (DUF496 family)